MRYQVLVLCRVFVEADSKAAATERAFEVTNNHSDDFEAPGRRVIVLDQSVGFDNDDVKELDKEPEELL
jgi:hypothetical protein